MPGFRTTKYDPRLRSADGSYAQEEWTSVTDVGKSFLGHTVQLSDYLSTENAYVETVHRFLEQCQVHHLRLRDLEQYDENCDLLPDALIEESKQWMRTITADQTLGGVALERAIRLTLRELIWCRLEGEAGFYVHFGYDYYMYIGSDRIASTPPELPPGIYVERFESPYHRDPDEE